MPDYRPILQNVLGGQGMAGAGGGGIGGKNWDPLMDVLGPEGFISMMLKSGQDAAGWDIGAQQGVMDRILEEIRKMGRYGRRQSMMPGAPGGMSGGGWR